MFLSVRHKPLQKEALRHFVINKDNDEEIPRVIWANDETGRYRQYLIDNAGKLIVENGEIKSKIFTGNIELRKRKST